MAGRILADFFAKGLDFFRKCAIIKIRGNTGDGYFLRLAEIAAYRLEAYRRLFLFVIGYVQHQLDQSYYKRAE